MLLMGCGAKGADESSAAVNEQTCAEIAQALVNDLGLTEAVNEAKTRVVYGQFFNAREGDEGLPVTDAAAYLPVDKNSDTVGVFRTDNADAVKAMLDEYLSAQTALSQMYSPEEVFKISNAIVDTSNDGKTIVLVVCNDIEDAKVKVAKALGK